MIEDSDRVKEGEAVIYETRLHEMTSKHHEAWCGLIQFSPIIFFQRDWS